MKKVLQAAAFALGVGAVIFTVRGIWSAQFLTDTGPDFDSLLRLVFQWPIRWYGLGRVLFERPDLLLGLRLVTYLDLLVLVLAPLCALFLTRSLDDTPRVTWRILVAVFPFLLLPLALIETNWYQRRRVERLTAKAAGLDDGKDHDLLFLQSKGFVRARGTGQSITRIYGEIENRVARKLRVVITPGTYFVAKGNYQNMVTREEYSFTLDPRSTRSVGIDAACINANAPIPGKSDRFYGVQRVSDDIARFLAASRNEHPMVVQAGVWTLTDKYSRSDVINHLISRDSRGNTWHPVTHDHCDRAKAILDNLGIANRL